MESNHGIGTTTVYDFIHSKYDPEKYNGIMQRVNAKFAPTLFLKGIKIITDKDTKRCKIVYERNGIQYNCLDGDDTVASYTDALSLAIEFAKASRNKEEVTAEVAMRNIRMAWEEAKSRADEWAYEDIRQARMFSILYKWRTTSFERRKLESILYQ